MYLPNKDEVFVCKNFLNQEECNSFIDMAPKLGKNVNGAFPWDKRAVDITDHPIVDRVRNFLTDHTNHKFNIDQAQIQNWHDGSFSELHIHNYDGREHIVFNSLIYLNNDYLGGEFYTKTAEIKPEIGMLTLFNGQETYHGVKQVEGKDRFTLIFWWRE